MSVSAILARKDDSLLTDMLRGYRFTEFWQPTDADHGPIERTWPDAVYEALVLAEHEWRRNIGQVIDRGRTTACIQHSGRNWCVVKLYYERVKEQPSLPLAAAAATDGSDQIAPLAGNAAVRSFFSPSLCEHGD